MSVKIRFLLVGKPRQRSFRLIAIDSRRKRNSNKFLEILGFHNPQTKESKLDKENIQKWLAVGAQPTLTVKNLLKKHGIKKEIPKINQST